jgi:hypothetical protein
MQRTMKHLTRVEAKLREERQECETLTEQVSHLLKRQASSAEQRVRFRSLLIEKEYPFQ